MDSGLKERRILITGASGGIGQATAKLLAADEADLALHCHTNRAAADALSSSLSTKTVVVQGDLREERDVNTVFSEAIAALGGLDGVVVNAGVWRPTPIALHDLSLAQWRETLDADLTSAFLTCRAFLRHVADAAPDAPAIVLIGSTAALFGEANHADYSAAKAALAYGLTRSLKNEIVRLAPRGRVNCVCPGWVNTRMAAGTTADAAAIARATATMSLRKIARPKDVAAAVAFLLSDTLAGHISGAVLPVAGGMEGRLLHPTSVDS